MRIIGGTFRGKALATPEGRDTRPTSDRTREALFNVLTHRFQGRDGFSLAGAVVVDAFAGSGALGLEALSRGADSATFLETGALALTALRANATACRVQDRCRVVRADATAPGKPPAGAPPATLVLLDPPYGQGLAPLCLAALADRGWLAPGALACVETEAKAPPINWPEGFSEEDQRAHGKARLTILQWFP
ncbi:MAG: 16S rRNA (guanine(966)-N(2))-methyltransferase RsmD [Rhodospirillum sp.]|nr:16S rRNA (guanine(966)-N(2))-methyltransferase RsmD [Rhodospirillum sp.]MCF8489261.1 16S rRNA (guanine(966)-N(2))-methyltransferase RsmD [Rhodospirillum sp.]MCF8502707.1 16S rRNA (guanine(966)-N(2))-methyltransferase RsmD [Rhodospirillum sp.]